MDDTPNQGKDQGQSGSPDDARPSNDGSNAERKLIEAALKGAEPASGWPESTQAWFEGAPLPPHGAFPGYDIVREIHRGGQGVVYQAVQLSTRRHVAIKVMHSGPFMGSSGKARFEREVQVLGQLDHPNIVRIHDSGVTKDDSCFYVMDYISGKPLDKLMNEGQLPIRESLKLFAKICDAVNAAHLKGVIHRDLKPSNIRIDKHGEPIVVDFGLAKLAIPELDAEGSGKLMSMTGQFIGSLPWASPEQADGSPTNIDVRTDVYSLGVILYQLLTSRFPYEVLGNMRDVLDNIMKAEPARPSTIRRKINDEVETIVLKALSKERERRYQSAGDLGRDVHRFLDGQPIEAKRDSGWYVLTKTMKRYRVPVAIGAGALASLVVFAIVVWVLYTDASEARDLAQDRGIAAEAARRAEAEQRALAETRFDNAYDLAGTMLTEFYDGIRDLRGATGAKLALAEKGVATLDALEADAGGDPQRLLTIGRGRLRLGDLYTGRGELHRVGKPEQGRALYAAALGIADELLADRPDWAPALRLRGDALAHQAHAARLMRNHERSVEFYEAALVAFDKAIGANPTDGSMGAIRLTHADTLLELGNTLVEQAALSESIDVRSRLQARAEATYERGRSAFERLAGELEGPESNRASLGQSRARVRLALMAIRASEAGVEQPDQAERSLQGLTRAVALLSDAISQLESLAAAEPANGVYPSDMCVAYDAWGQALRQQARVLEANAGDGDDRAATLQAATDARTEAIDVLSTAIDMARRAVNTDESDVTYHRTLSHLLNKRARALDALGAHERAERDFVESAGIRDMLASTDPTGQHLNDAMVGWYYLGVFREGQADRTDGDASLQEALAAFEKARGYIERQQQADMSTDNDTLATIDARIKAVRDKLSSG